jgi:hypothetical protein
MPNNIGSLLSICIVTFNRGSIIRQNLEKLSPIAVKYNIPIFISDNASPDDTEKIINDFKNKYENIYFYRQTTNISYDKSAEFIIKQPNTKYRWLIGDKTVINKSSITILLDDLCTNEYDLYIVKDIREYQFDEKVYTDKNFLLSEMGWYMTYTGSMIYNEKLITNTSYSHYHDTGFIHMGIVFEYCNNHNFIAKVNPNIITDSIKLDEKTHYYWQNYIPIESFCKNWFLFVMSLPVRYTFEAKRKCIRDHGIKSGFFCIKNLLKFRMKCLFSLKILFKYKYFIKQTIIYPTILLLFISLIPPKFIYIIFLIRKKFK